MQFKKNKKDEEEQLIIEREYWERFRNVEKKKKIHERYQELEKLINS
ncbi:MAG: hypothetical protein ACTSU4_07665 [Promethearchaeota archaeon]